MEQFAQLFRNDKVISPLSTIRRMLGKILRLLKDENSVGILIVCSDGRINQYHSIRAMKSKLLLTALLLQRQLKKVSLKLFTEI